MSDEKLYKFTVCKFAEVIVQAKSNAEAREAAELGIARYDAEVFEDSKAVAAFGVEVQDERDVPRPWLNGFPLVANEDARHPYFNPGLTIGEILKRRGEGKKKVKKKK